MELVRPAEITRNRWQPQLLRATGFTDLVQDRSLALRDGDRSWRQFLAVASPPIRRRMMQYAKDTDTRAGYYELAFVDIPQVQMHPSDQDPSTGKLRLLDAARKRYGFSLVVNIAPEFGLQDAESIPDEDLQALWISDIRLLMLYHSDGLDIPMFYQRLQMSNSPLLRPIPQFSGRLD